MAQESVRDLLTTECTENYMEKLFYFCLKKRVRCVRQRI